MKVLPILAISMLVIGCSPSDPEASPPQPTAQTTAPSNEQGGVTPMTTAPIGSAPVSGSENLQGSGGGGGGVGTAAKSMAKGVAGGNQGSAPDGQDEGGE
ncbi:MAG: hypothetical protein ABL949_03945 [Fimbriimonadaceae bacterium]